MRPSEQFPSKIQRSPRFLEKPADAIILACISISGCLTNCSVPGVVYRVFLVVALVVLLIIVYVCPHVQQATLGVLYAQPPLAQDDNAATDRTMVVGVVEPVSEGKKMKEGIEDLPSPGGSANARVDVSLNGANVAVGVDARGVGDVAGDTPLAPPPALVSIDEQQRQDEAGDIQDLTEVPEVRFLFD